MIGTGCEEKLLEERKRLREKILETQFISLRSMDWFASLKTQMIVVAVFLILLRKR